MLLAVGINGLRPEIQKIVWNKESKSYEELTHYAIMRMPFNRLWYYAN